MEIKVTAPKVGDLEAVVNYDLGANLTEAVEKFTEEVVYNLYIGQAVVRIQQGLRNCLEKGIDPQKWISEYKLGSRGPSVSADPKASIMANFAKMSDEEKAEILAQLKA